MDRRDFIITTTSSVLAVSGVGASAPIMRLPAKPVVMPQDMDDYIARVDAGMARIGQWSPTADLPNFVGDRKAADEIGRASMQSLFLTGMFSDLPIEGQLHPGMQDRVIAAMPVMDKAVDGISAFLRSRTEADKAAIQAALQDWGAGVKVAAAVDREAAHIGLSEWRRSQTRSMFAHAEWRLRTQPPSLIINECLRRVEKLSATDVTAAAKQRALAARLGEAAFWRHAAERANRDARVGRGGKVLGIGVLIFAAGGLIVAAGGGAGVFVMTAGAIVIIVGLVMLAGSVIKPIID
jgi:hypothetical protein